MRIVVLGGGRIGSAIARDLAAEARFDVTVADRSAAALAAACVGADLATARTDVADADQLARVLAGHDLAVGAVPGHMGFRTLRQVIAAGKPVVDISFFEENTAELDALARERGTVALVDAGVAPGCSNLILGHLERVLDSTTRFECLVGGLPVARRWPFEYKAPFSPSDVVEEYTRPARLRRDGIDVTLPALSEVEPVDFDGLGTLEAFNTDGLRTLLDNARTPTMIEKTLRYPGHADRMRALRETGFFGKEPIEVDGHPVRPRDLTSRLLFDAWRYDEGEEDLTAMRVAVEGERDGRPETHTFTLLDRYDRATGTSSMARTTGYTCTAMVNLVADGRYTKPGVSPPEIVAGAAGCYEYVMEHLASRGVVFRHAVQS